MLNQVSTAPWFNSRVFFCIPRFDLIICVLVHESLTLKAGDAQADRRRDGHLQYLAKQRVDYEEVGGGAGVNELLI